MTKFPGQMGPRGSTGQEETTAASFRPRLRSSVDEEPLSVRSAVPEPTAAELQVILRIVCEAGSSILEATHQYVTVLAKARFRPTIAEKISLACWELFSNALSYGSVSRPVVLELCALKNTVELRVSNDAIAARCQLLEQRIQQLKVDAKGTYLEEMRRSVTGGVPRATLGLARVAHEVKMDLHASVVNSGRVTVVASCAL
jgi:hypothetical protein